MSGTSWQGDAEYELRLALARRLPQMHQPRDRVARWIAKVLCLACGLALAIALLALANGINWTFIGQ